MKLNPNIYSQNEHFGVQNNQNIPYGLNEYTTAPTLGINNSYNYTNKALYDSFPGMNYPNQLSYITNIHGIQQNYTEPVLFVPQTNNISYNSSSELLPSTYQVGNLGISGSYTMNRNTIPPLNQQYMNIRRTDMDINHNLSGGNNPYLPIVNNIPQGYTNLTNNPNIISNYTIPNNTKNGTYYLVNNDRYGTIQNNTGINQNISNISCTYKEKNYSMIYLGKNNGMYYVPKTSGLNKFDVPRSNTVEPINKKHISLESDYMKQKRYSQSTVYRSDINKNLSIPVAFKSNITGTEENCTTSNYVYKTTPLATLSQNSNPIQNQCSPKNVTSQTVLKINQSVSHSDPITQSMMNEIGILNRMRDSLSQNITNSTNKNTNNQTLQIPTTSVDNISSNPIQEPNIFKLKKSCTQYTSAPNPNITSVISPLNTTENLNNYPKLVNDFKLTSGLCNLEGISQNNYISNSINTTTDTAPITLLQNCCNNSDESVSSPNQVITYVTLGPNCILQPESESLLSSTSKINTNPLNTDIIRVRTSNIDKNLNNKPNLNELSFSSNNKTELQIDNKTNFEEQPKTPLKLISNIDNESLNSNTNIIYQHTETPFLDNKDIKTPNTNTNPTIGYLQDITNTLKSKKFCSHIADKSVDRKTSPIIFNKSNSVCYFINPSNTEEHRFKADLIAQKRNASISPSLNTKDMSSLSRKTIAELCATPFISYQSHILNLPSHLIGMNDVTSQVKPQYPSFATTLGTENLSQEKLNLNNPISSNYNFSNNYKKENTTPIIKISDNINMTEKKPFLSHNAKCAYNVRCASCSTLPKNIPSQLSLNQVSTQPQTTTPYSPLKAYKSRGEKSCEPTAYCSKVGTTKIISAARAPGLVARGITSVDSRIPTGTPGKICSNNPFAVDLNGKFSQVPTSLRTMFTQVLGKKDTLSATEIIRCINPSIIDKTQSGQDKVAVRSASLFVPTVTTELLSRMRMSLNTDTTSIQSQTLKCYQKERLSENPTEESITSTDMSINSDQNNTAFQKYTDLDINSRPSGFLLPHSPEQVFAASRVGSIESYIEPWSEEELPYNCDNSPESDDSLWTDDESSAMKNSYQNQHNDRYTSNTTDENFTNKHGSYEVESLQGSVVMDSQVGSYKSSERNPSSWRENNDEQVSTNYGSYQSSKNGNSSADFHCEQTMSNYNENYQDKRNMTDYHEQHKYYPDSQNQTHNRYHQNSYYKENNYNSAPDKNKKISPDIYVNPFFSENPVNNITPYNNTYENSSNNTFSQESGSMNIAPTTESYTSQTNRYNDSCVSNSNILNSTDESNFKYQSNPSTCEENICGFSSKTDSSLLNSEFRSQKSKSSRGSTSVKCMDQSSPSRNMNSIKSQRSMISQVQNNKQSSIDKVYDEINEAGFQSNSSNYPGSLEGTSAINTTSSSLFCSHTSSKCSATGKSQKDYNSTITNSDISEKNFKSKSTIKGSSCSTNQSSNYSSKKEKREFVNPAVTDRESILKSVESKKSYRDTDMDSLQEEPSNYESTCGKSLSSTRSCASSHNNEQTISYSRPTLTGASLTDFEITPKVTTPYYSARGELSSAQCTPESRNRTPEQNHETLLNYSELNLRNDLEKLSNIRKYLESAKSDQPVTANFERMISKIMDELNHLTVRNPSKEQIKRVIADSRLLLDELKETDVSTRALVRNQVLDLVNILRGIISLNSKHSSPELKEEVCSYPHTQLGFDSPSRVTISGLKKGDSIHISPGKVTQNTITHISEEGKYIQQELKKLDGTKFIDLNKSHRVISVNSSKTPNNEVTHKIMYNQESPHKPWAIPSWQSTLPSTCKVTLYSPKAIESRPVSNWKSYKGPLPEKCTVYSTRRESDSVEMISNNVQCEKPMIKESHIMSSVGAQTLENPNILFDTYADQCYRFDHAIQHTSANYEVRENTSSSPNYLATNYMMEASSTNNEKTKSPIKIYRQSNHAVSLGMQWDGRIKDYVLPSTSPKSKITIEREPEVTYDQYVEPNIQIFNPANRTPQEQSQSYNISNVYKKKATGGCFKSTVGIKQPKVQQPKPSNGPLQNSPIRVDTVPPNGRSTMSELLKNNASPRVDTGLNRNAKNSSELLKNNPNILRNRRTTRTNDPELAMLMKKAEAVRMRYSSMVSLNNSDLAAPLSTYLKELEFQIVKRERELKKVS